MTARTATAIRARCLGWVGVVCAAASCLGQRPSDNKLTVVGGSSSYVPHLAFDVVSIREVRGATTATMDVGLGSSLFVAEDVSLWGLVITAYDVKIGALLKGVPAWAGDIHYNVEAKSDEATDRALAKLSESDFRAEKRHMLQLMLAERFHLRAHQENRMGTTYELVATPRAAKLMTPVEGDLVKTISTCTPEYSHKGVEVKSKGCPFYDFFSQLEQELGTPITDRTGMKGVFAYHLAYSMRLDVPPDVEQFPYIVNAVREELGLELKRGRGLVMFLVVDGAQPPTPN